MAKMTLDEIYIETASYIDEEITKTGGVYLGDSLVLTNKFKSSINYIYKKLAKENYKLIYKENIMLDANKQFSISSLTKTLFQVDKIESSADVEVDWRIIPSEKIECKYSPASSTVTVYYYYLPAILTALTDTMEFPEASVDNLIPCFYTAYRYLSQETDSNSQIKASNNLNLFNDAVSQIRQSRGELEMIEDVYDTVNSLR